MATDPLHPKELVAAVRPVVLEGLPDNTSEEQQDPVELLERCLSNEAGWPDALFRSQQRMTVTCQRCDHRSIREDPGPGVLHLSVARPGPLDRLLEECSVTPLEGYRCDGCRSSVAAKQSISFLSSPQVLVISFKRLTSVEPGARKGKAKVTIPETDLLLPTAKGADGASYDLCSVIIHLGGAKRRRHFACICRTSRGWRLYDDHKVWELDDFGAVQRWGQGCGS